MSNNIKLTDDLIDLALANKAINAANDGITIVDITLPDQPLIYVNKAFEDLTGYKKSEILGNNCRFLQGDLHDQPNVIKVHETIENHQSCRVILKNFKKDGTLFWNELSLAPVPDENGKPHYYIGVQKDVTLEMTQREKIIYLSEHDELTGVYNYRGFFSKIENLINTAIKQDRFVCVGMADIDYFKKINDRYGHMIANNILKIISSELAQEFYEGDVIARFGGDEFCFAMIVRSSDTQFFYHKIHNALRATNIILSNSLQVTMSSGAVIEKATFTTKIDHLIHLADNVMYENKQLIHVRDIK